jgi:AcrR family transcriptional regulator
MPLETTAPSATTRTGPATRERILSVANDLFYAQGIRATSADRIIEEAGITKVTFYRHFRTKGELVVAYLQAQSRAEQAWMTSVHDAGDPLTSLRRVAAGIGTAGCQPGFRGCAFINAAAEFSNPDDPVRAAVDAHRDWIHREFAAIAAEAGVVDPESVGRQLVVLRDGGMVSGYLNDATELTASLEAAFTAVVLSAPRAPESIRPAS